jgi:adenosylhomocysteine nucleosidase
MHLITMAHPGEAQGVIEEFKLKRLSPDLYLSDEMVLLITGEGPFEAATKTAMIISKYKIQEIINLGFAGSLSTELKVGEVYPVRTVYLLQQLKPGFKTFQSFEKGVDCLTSFERILDPEKAQQLKGLGHLVDREAWGVATAAKTAGLPFKAFKIVSDNAGTLDACELVKERARDLAFPLSSHLKKYLNIKEDQNQSQDDSLKGFYFTFTTQHRYQSLLNKLSIKEDLVLEETKKILPLARLLDEKNLPKERARLLIEWLENRIDPVKKILLKRKDAWVKTFEDQGLRVQTDPHWENPAVTISFEVTTDQELEAKIYALKNVSIAPFNKLMNGDFHVE